MLYVTTFALYWEPTSTGMPEYDLHVLCLECGSFHDALFRVSVEQTFDVRRVSDVYQEKVPLMFYQAIAGIQCPTTRETLKQENPEMMVLVAVGRKRLGASSPD